jgi:hypothetical protein
VKTSQDDADQRLAVALELVDDAAPHGEDVALLVHGLVGAGQFSDLDLVAHPVLKGVEHVGVTEVAHPEGPARIAGLAAFLVVHVEGHELVVHGREPVPMHEVGGPGPFGDRIAYRHVLETDVDAHRPLNS